MQKNKKEKRFQQYSRHLNKGIDNMLDNLEALPALQDQMLTVAPRRFEALVVLD